MEMIDQQAPAAFLQAWPVVNHALSMNTQRMKGGTTFHKKKRVTMVRMELKTPLKRLFFTHPMGPTLVIGGLNSSVWTACSMLSLYKGDSLIIPVHEG